MNSKVSYAIAAILGGASLAAPIAAPAADNPDTGASSGTDALAEITVTAQRRTESMQDVPISMQALHRADAAATQRRDASTTTSSTCRT